MEIIFLSNMSNYFWRTLYIYMLKYVTYFHTDKNNIYIILYEWMNISHYFIWINKYVLILSSIWFLKICQLVRRTSIYIACELFKCNSIIVLVQHALFPLVMCNKWNLLINTLKISSFKYIIRKGNSKGYVNWKK